MARETKRAREARIEAERQKALWDSWDAELAALHGGPDPFVLVDIPDEPEPVVEESAGYNPFAMDNIADAYRRVRDMQLDPLRSFGGRLVQSAADLVDAASIDPNALALEQGSAEDFYSVRGQLESLGETLEDINLGMTTGLANIGRRIGLPLVREDIAEEARQASRDRALRREQIEAERAAAGLPSTEDIRRISPFNTAADWLRNRGRVISESISPELQAAQRALGEATEEGVFPMLRQVASPQGVRALASGVIPEAGAYAAQAFGGAGALRAAGAAPRLAQAGSNVALSYNIAQTNANAVEESILNLEAHEAWMNPEIAEMAERMGGDIEAAKRAVATIARQNTIAASAAAAPLYQLDVFSRAGAGLAGARTATMRQQVLGSAARESGGEFLQGAAESIAEDLGAVAGGEAAVEDIGSTALASGTLEALAGAPLAGGMAGVQASANFDRRASRLEDIANVLDEIEALRRAEAEAAAAAEAETAVPSGPDPSRADPEDGGLYDAAPLRPEGLRTVEESAEEEAIRLALSGIQAPPRPERPVSSVRKLSADEREIVNRRLLAMQPSDPAQAEAVSAPRPEGLDESRSARLRDSRGRFTGQQPGRAPNASPSQEALLADAERQAAQLLAQQEEEASSMDAAMEQEAALSEAEAFIREERERGDAEARKRLGIARGQHTRARRAHLQQVMRDNEGASDEELRVIIAEARAAWEAANPEPTLETLPPEAPRSRSAAVPARLRSRLAGRTTTPPQAATEDPAATEQTAAPEEESAPPVPRSRREELVARYGRAQEGTTISEGSSAGDVLRALAGRVRSGNDRTALAAAAMLEDGKLSIVDPDVMATVPGASETTQGYYDGERMYINAAQLPPGDVVGVLFNSVLAHEANHAASMSQNPDAVSKARVLLEDAPRQRLIEQLETATHPTAVAAREAVAARRIDKATDPARYEDEIIAYAINNAIETGGRSWAPIRGLVSAARRKWREFTGSDNLNLNDLAHYANETIYGIAESEADIRAPGAAGRGQAASDVQAMQAEAEQLAQDSGLATAQAMVEGTATRTADNVMLPVELLQTIPGTIDESRGPGDGQYDRLLAAVESDGWSNNFPIDVRVNHRGEPYIVDGNTRVAVAAARGVSEIPANVQWMNGAEAVDGPLTPAVVEGQASQGRAQEAVPAAPVAPDLYQGPYVRTRSAALSALAKDAFTVYGAVGENVGRLFQEANYERDAVYQTAIHRYHRVGPALNRAAEKALAGEKGTIREKRERFNNMILDRLNAIAELPSDSVKDKQIARLVQQYPDLAPLADAIQDINKMTDRIISSRLRYADSRPLTNEEWQLYDFMDRNKYRYLTNVYAAFQGESGRRYTEALLNAGAQGYKALAEGKEVPANIKNLYQVYDNALRFVMENDVAVSDPELLAAMSLQDIRALYDRWMPHGIRAEDLAIMMREENDGVLDTDSYKSFMEDAIAEHVSVLKDPEFVTEDGDTGSNILRREADAVIRGLLENAPIPGPAARYAKARGIDTTILQHRAELPSEIADLYGQIRDIPSLINATLTRQGELASRLNFFNRLAEEAYGDAVIDAADRSRAGNERFTVRLSGPSFGRLNGMYTTPEMAQRLADYGTMFSDIADTLAVVGVNPSMGRRWMEHKLGRAWTGAAGLQKGMKIITRPDYTLLNLAGSFSAPVLAGGVKPAHLVTGLKVALEHLAHQIDPKGRVISAELSAAHQLALQTGAFDNAVTQELRRAPRKLVNRLLEEMSTVDDVSGVLQTLKRAKDWSKDRGWQTLVEAYSLADTWIKLPVMLERMDFLESYYKANGDNVTNEQIQREAARFMRDATISMDNVPGIVKLTERTGLTFYLPYFASVFRVLGKSVQHTGQSIQMAFDAKTPEAKWIAAKDAARKVAGQAVVWGTALMGLRLLSEASLDDKEKEQMERDRELMFDEGKYGDLFYVGTNDQGHRQYFLTSRTDQFGPAFDIARAVMRSDSPGEALEQVGRGFWDLVVANRFFGATLDHVRKGGKNTQLERTLPAATEWLKSQANTIPKGYAAMDYLLTVGDLITPAGVMNYFDPRNKTPTEVDNDAAAILSSIAAATGHRLITVNPEAAIGGKSRELSELRRNANRRIRDSIEASGPEQGFKTFLQEAARERALAEELGKMYHAVRDSGMSPRKIEESMSSLDSTSISNIRRRAYTTDSNSWIKRWSALLSDSSIKEPPTFPDLPEAERRQAQRDWQRQARDVRRKVRAMNIQEKK